MGAGDLFCLTGDPSGCQPHRETRCYCDTVLACLHRWNGLSHLKHTARLSVSMYAPSCTVSPCSHHSGNNIKPRRSVPSTCSRAAAPSVLCIIAPINPSRTRSLAQEASYPTPGPAAGLFIRTYIHTYIPRRELDRGMAFYRTKPCPVDPSLVTQTHNASEYLVTLEVHM